MSCSSIPIVYLDDDLLCAEKPAGLLSVPGRTREKQHCLYHVLRADYDPLYVVHRLDRDTSGLILFARTAATQRILGRMFAARRIEKLYLADVQGQMEANEGVISAPIARVPGSSLPPRYQVDVEGKSATTSWRVMYRTDTSTRLRLAPATGRSHQLRVHCLALEHPILGDPIYGLGEKTGNRLHLHAWRLTFAHPRKPVMLRLSRPAPF